MSENFTLQSFSFTTVRFDAKDAISSQETGRARYFIEDLGNSIYLEMVEVPGGTFAMGSPSNEKSGYGYERPQHEVTVPSFYLGKYAVTQEQWQAVVGTDPSQFKGRKRPVEMISWHDAKKFCQRLSEKTEKQYRLPSEAEWEYACRSGTMTLFHYGAKLTADVANYGSNQSGTIDVGNFPANAFGLYDMHGNVWEWCADDWHESYTGAPSDATAWLRGHRSSTRVLRGGSWFSDSRSCRSSHRDVGNAANSNGYFGIRVACSRPGDPS